MKKYLTLLVLTIVLVAITLYFSLYVTNEEQSTVTGDKFYRVLFDGEDLQPLLDGEESNWKYLVQLEHAAKNPALSESLSVYRDLAIDEKVPIVLRELAQYLKVMNSFYHDKVSDEGLASSMVYPYSSKEVVAIVKIHNNDINGALEILHSLASDRKCPAFIKANVNELLQIYEK